MASTFRLMLGKCSARILRPVTSAWGSVSRRHLPICTVDTNLSKSQLPQDFSVQFSKHIAGLLNKPEKLVSVVVRNEVNICRNSNTKPAVSVQIWSVGVFDNERNPGYSEAMVKFILSKLDVTDDRVTILFHPIEKNDAGHLLYADMKK